MPRNRILAGAVLVVWASAMPADPAHAQFESLRKFTQSSTASKKIAHFRIAGELVETPVRIPPILGSEPPESLNSLLERFKEARLDDAVVAVVVDLQDATPGFAQVEEIRDALRKFSAVDKEVYIHADALTTLTYAAAIGASHISIVPTGDLWLTGLYGEMPYLRGTLEKIGVTADFEQCGDFKTAAEPLTRTGPSKQSEEMTQWLLDSIYQTLVDSIAEARNMTAEEVRTLIDHGPYFAEAAREAGLIDSVQHYRDFIAGLKSRYGTDVRFVSDYGKDDLLDLPQNNPWAVFEFLMEMLNPIPKAFSSATVALVYVEGVIATGEAEASPFSAGGTGAFSTTIRRALDKAADEPHVRAVVLRVDSPGGSALASEIILHAAKRVAAKKPLIVSMGNVAGSGGYYVSCGGNEIFADAGTITASIGVVGGKLVTTPMWDKLGVKWYGHQRGDMAAMLSSAAPFSDAERTKLRSHIDAVYNVFKTRVTDARGDRLAKPIDDIAGGRVYTGRQAMELGLIDKIGGLEEALRAAADRAGLHEYELRVIPEPPTIFDLLMGGDEKSDDFTFGGKGPTVLHFPMVRSMWSAISTVDPLRAQAIIHGLQAVELIHREGAAMIMPGELVIR